MTKPLATAGELLTCENGHVIAEVARDLMPFEMISPGDFTHWRMGKPTSDEVAPCMCGALYINVKSFGGVYPHIGDEWRK